MSFFLAYGGEPRRIRVSELDQDDLAGIVIELLDLEGFQLPEDPDEREQLVNEALQFLQAEDFIASPLIIEPMPARAEADEAA